MSVTNLALNNEQRRNTTHPAVQPRLVVAAARHREPLPAGPNRPEKRESDRQGAAGPEPPQAAAAAADPNRPELGAADHAAVDLGPAEPPKAAAADPNHPEPAAAGPRGLATTAEPLEAAADPNRPEPAAAGPRGLATAAAGPSLYATDHTCEPTFSARDASIIGAVPPWAGGV
jgi:hypothetical protein